MHSRHDFSLRRLLLAGSVMLAAAPAMAADVTSERARQCRPGAGQLADEPPHL